MKVKFSKLVPFTPTWRGNQEQPEAEQIKAIIKPLRTGDMLYLLDELQKAAKEVNADGKSVSDEKVAAKKAGDVVASCGHMLLEHVQLTGLETDDGPVSIEDVVTYSVFFGLAYELLNGLAKASMPTEEDRKN